jgi:DNA-binding response OmpR family regulator
MVVGKKIVIVEDEPDTAEMLAEMVRLLGFQAVKSYGGIRAIDMIADIRPAAVLLDLMMPDLSGMEVMGYMQRDPRLEHIPVIIISARGMPSDVQSGLKAGASVYLTKPVSFVELREAVERVVHN